KRRIAFGNLARSQQSRPPAWNQLDAGAPDGRARRLRRVLRLGHADGEHLLLFQPAVLQLAGVRPWSLRHADVEQPIPADQRVRAAADAEHAQSINHERVSAALEYGSPAGIPGG